MEKVAGKKFQLDDLKRAVALSRECSELWKKILDTASAKPAPLTFIDGTTLMGPAVVGRGTQKAVDVYKILLAELLERIKMGEGALENEKFRIYWDGMPVWGRLSAHSQLFAALNANVLASTYCNSWIFSALDPADPMTSLARASLELFIARTEAPKERYLEEMVVDYAVDGIVFHDCRTCPNNSNTRYGMPRRLSERLGIPTLVLDGDVNDLRCFSDEQSRTNIEGFVEQLADARAAGRGAAGQSATTNNITWQTYQELAQRREVAWTIPLSLGDSHRGFRVLGTSPDYYVHYRFAGDRTLQFAAGEPGADLFDAVIGADVHVGAGTWIGAHVVLEGRTHIGRRNRIFHRAVSGAVPQDLKYRDEATSVRLGDDNTVREYATIHLACLEGESTVVGDRCLLMAYSHVAHNCRIGNGVILANSVNLAGHVEVHDHAIVGGVTPVHQFVRIGAYSIIGGGFRVPKDVPPFVRAGGYPLRVIGLNTVGLERQRTK